MKRPASHPGQERDAGPTSVDAYDSRPDTWTHIHEVQGRLMQVADELTERALRHDQSKLTSPEVEVFNEYTPKLKDSTYGSDEYKAFLKGMGVGLQHHYAHNDHHPEHFIDGDPVGHYSAGDPNSRWERAPRTGIAAMDLMQITEMLCDWKAATMRHADGDLGRSIEQNAARFGYGDEIKGLLRNTALALGWL